MATTIIQACKNAVDGLVRQGKEISAQEAEAEVRAVSARAGLLEAGQRALLQLFEDRAGSAPMTSGKLSKQPLSNAPTPLTLAFEQALAGIYEEGGTFQSCAAVPVLADLAIWGTVQTPSLLPAHWAIAFLEDVLAFETLTECRHVISWLTEQSRKDLLLDGTKFKTLYIIRMCTQLMKRMSKSNDTIFCGQVLMLMSYIIPMDDKSACNLKSAQNTDNITVIEPPPASSPSPSPSPSSSPDTDADTKGKSRDVGDDKDTPMTDGDNNGSGDKDGNGKGGDGMSIDTALGCIDYGFYRQLWRLQGMLAQPTSFSGKRSTSTSINIRGKSIDKSKGKGKSKGEDAELSEEWKELTTALDAVYEVFEKNRISASSAAVSSSSKYPKFLTGVRLLNLQLQDPALRRHILLQVAIFFHYLTSPMEKRKQHLVLSQGLSQLIRRYQDRTFALLRATPSPQAHMHARAASQALSKNKRRKNRKDRTANTGDGEGGEGGEGGSIFVREVEAVLRSERHWQQWKGRKCASYVQQATSLTKALQLESTESEIETAEERMMREMMGLPAPRGVGRGGRLEMGCDELQQLFDQRTDRGTLKREGRRFVPEEASLLGQMVDECELEEGMDEADKLVSDKRYIFRCLRVVASSVKSCSEGELPSGSSSTFSKFFPALRPTKTMFDTLLREKKHKLSGGEHQEKAQKRTFAGKRQQEDGETRKKPKLGVASSE